MFQDWQFGLLDSETAILCAFATLTITTIGRKANGGPLLDPDRMVSDGIAGVTTFVMILLLWALAGEAVMEKMGWTFPQPLLDRWSEKPQGQLTIFMAMLHVILSRIRMLSRSFSNIQRCKHCTP
ncbi:MAG: hypothetical protein OIF48_06350 [Silicimonas sp.]|nr:hypothetical protein [Silicimonas sp.]